MATPSEALLAAFCRQQGYTATKIAVGAAKTPDFQVDTPRGRIIVEVKQFEPNAEELAARRNWEAGRITVVTGRPGQRVRSAISTAVRQINRATGGTVPGMVVLWDPERLGHGGEYNIRVAMFGYDTLVLAVPPISLGSPTVVARKSGLTCG